MENYYINKQINNNYIGILNDMVNKIKNNERVIFTKFGDGEYNCMNNHDGCNCDGDKYSEKMGKELIESFIILCDLYNSKNENIYIGRWHSCIEKIIGYYGSIYYDYLLNNNKTIKDIPFVDYHFCYNYHPFVFKENNLYDFVKIIRESNKFKILITNNNNEKLNIVFNTNFFLKIQNNCWYEKYENVYNYVDKILSLHEDAIILIAGGLASKILIKDLSLKYNKASFIDIGSGFDLLATKKLSRCSEIQHTYNDEFEYYKDLLPNDY